jgi:dihydroflavonol-4-reductase
MPPMATTLVTGGSGFIGSHLVRALAARGDDLRLLARRSADLGHLSEVDFDRATGDVTDRRAVRRAVKGVERIFHVAGTTSLRAGDRDRVFDVNVRGTRVVLEEAMEAGVEHAVFTSSVAAVGPARPRGTVDESHLFDAGHLGIPYVNSKHEAEVEALRLAARGLPLVCVNPTFCFGPDDPKGTSMALIRRFLLRQIPAYVDGGLNIVDVRDVARGHVLADEKGKVGERYILGGRNFTFDRLFADLARISGVDPPPVKLPRALVLAAVEAAAAMRLPVPVSPDEVRGAALWWTCRNAKARRELGFEPRPHEDTLEDAVRWQLDHLEGAPGEAAGPETLVLGALGRAMRAGERIVAR